MNWWGTFSLDINTCLHWQLSNCSFYIERNSHQWIIHHHYLQDASLSSLKIAEITPSPSSINTMVSDYFNFEKTSSHITLMPSLADRPQVSRPEFTLYIAAHEQIILYISTPLWVRISAGKALRILQEIPLSRLSDTWFGETTLEGELCYASRTRCRTELGTDPLFPYRAITQVTIQNQRSENLLIQRIKLPLPLLSLFAAKEGYLCTENILIEATPAGASTTAITKETPRFITNPKLLSNPRTVIKPSKIKAILESVWHD